MAKPKKESWQKRHRQLPHGKRVTARLNNEITRLENTVQLIKTWPDEEHGISELKEQINSSLAWLRNAKATAERIPDSFAPRIRRSARKMEVGDAVRINTRYCSDYGLKGTEVFEISAVVGKRFRITNDAGLVIVAPKGHLMHGGAA